MIIQDNNFCCYAMKESFEDDKIIQYSNIFRRYFIDIDEKSYRQLEFCPWCGVKLPKVLNREFFDTLENEYHFDLDNLDFPDFKNAPKEMQTDEWWKKRGL